MSDAYPAPGCLAARHLGAALGSIHRAPPNLAEAVTSKGTDDLNSQNYLPFSIVTGGGSGQGLQRERDRDPC